MTYVPGQGPCLRCLLKTVPAREELCAQVGVLGSMTGLLGCIQATEAIKYVLGIGELLTGRLLLVDGLSMSVQEVDMGPVNTECRVCGAHPAITSLSDNREDYETSGCTVP